MGLEYLRRSSCCLLVALIAYCGGSDNESKDADSSAKPDVTAPADPAGFTASSRLYGAVLSFSNPADSDFAGVRLVRKLTNDISGASDGQLVCDNCTSPYHDQPLLLATTYYYKAFAFDSSGNFSSGASASVTVTASAPTPLKIMASDKQTLDRFGNAIALGNGFALISAYQEDGGAGDPKAEAGAVYGFSRLTDGSWVENQILRASNAEADDRFGFALGLSGQLMVVGANREDGGAGNPITDGGGAYVFERQANGNWLEKAILHPSDQGLQDYFGQSVAISGTYIIVGAPQENGGPTNPANDAGAAYVFEQQPNGSWLEKAALHASDLQLADQFGWSVAIAGDYAAVGAIWEAGGAGNPVAGAGTVYIFERQGDGSWPEKAILRASDRQTGDNFGWHIAMQNNRIAISAESEDGGAGNPANGAGAVYVFERQPNGSWLEQAILHASDKTLSDSFGNQVALDGDLVLVGARDEDGGSGDPAGNSGAAYLFERNGAGTWVEKMIVRASDTEANDSFGISVSLGHGFGMVGAFVEDGGPGNPAVDAGACYAF